MDKSTYDLERLAKQAMEEKGLLPEFSKQVMQQLQEIDEPASPDGGEDFRKLLWCSIDNDNSKDLDQLTYAQKESNGNATIWVAIADVDALVQKGTPIDAHAQINTVSVYTPARIFSMLPEKLSTNLTSLNEKEDRVAIVVKVTIASNGEIKEGSISHALVRNNAKLAYNALGAWLEGKGPIPEKINQVPGLEQVIKYQHEIAQLIKNRRHASGALTLESPEPEAKVKEKSEIVLEIQLHNAAHELIENFMIAANHVIAEKLKTAQISSLRRVVRVPKRWDRIVDVAADLGEKLPEDPDSKALEAFLIKQKKREPEAFPDLSLTIIKLLGRGEYVVESVDSDPLGHFGLALEEYTHSTAPNRRYPDLITQRQIKAFLQGKKSPYLPEELQFLAEHCTQQEDAATKVERHMVKSAAALLLSSSIGMIFHGIITGAGEKGTWVRLFSPPVEGKLVQGFNKLDVGDRVTVKLASVDVPKGFLNFVR